MKQSFFKKDNEIDYSLKVEESVTFSIEDHSETIGGCWFRFTIGIDLGSCSCLGPLQFNTSSKQLLDLSEKFKEWSEILRLREEQHELSSKSRQHERELKTKEALDKLTEEDIKVLGIRVEDK